MRKLGKVKRAMELHDKQKKAQENRKEELEEGGKEMYILRWWREKVCLREDSPETIHKS